MRDMKDSGIDWIGEIPVEWKIIKIKNLPDQTVENNYIDGDWIESTDISEDGIRYLTTGNIGDGTFKQQGNGYVSLETFIRLNCKYAYPGDLVISRLNAPYGRACILPNDYPEYVLAVDNVILRPTADKRYICYITQCKGYQYSVEDQAKGTTMKRISRTNLGNIVVPLPMLEEQTRIADYLDRKCAAIDNIIAKQEQIIERLKSYKLSLITEAVNKGLDSNVEMKDSGIDWLGTINNNYIISTFKRYSNVNQGLQIAQSERKYEDGEGRYRYITVKYLNSDDKDNTVEYIENPPFSTICEEEDVLMARTGATGMVVTGVQGCFHNNFFKINYDRNELVRDYLVFYLMQDSIKSYLLLMAGTTTIPDLNHSDFYSTPLVIPPIEEQIQISEFLSRKCFDIDELVKKKQMIITKIKELKKSLIYEAVTGKKEV